MAVDTSRLRQDSVAVCQRLDQRSLIAGTEGHVSARMAPDRVWMPPSGVLKGLLQPGEFLLIDVDGQVDVGAESAAFNTMETVERAAQVYDLAKTLGRRQPLSPDAVAALQALRAGSRGRLRVMASMGRAGWHNACQPTLRPLEHEEKERA